MKFARQCSRLLLLALISPTVALALGLGDIHLKSTLDAPLDADIDLVDAQSEDLSTLKATLAPRDTFKHFGADYPSFLGTVTLTPERTADGRAVLHVRSASVAGEPFATLLVEVDWSRGHLVREYTLLLDPPVFNSQTPSNASVAAPAAGASAQSGLVEHPAGSTAGNATSADNTATPSAAPDNASSASSATATTAGTATPAAPSSNEPSVGSATASSGSTGSSTASTAPTETNPSATGSGAQAPVASEAAPSNTSAGSGSGSGSSVAAARAAPGSYTVRRGDTLSHIADENYSGDAGTRARALVAIYRANPKAFRDNMNTLYTGAVLTLPGDSELEAIGPGEAVTEVRHQYDEWRGQHGGEQVAGNTQGTRGAGGQLRLVAPQEGGEPAAAAPSPASASASTASTGQGSGNGRNGTAANAALQQRVQQLEAQLAESQRLLQLRSAELSALQARVQQQAQTAAPTPAPPAPIANQSAAAPVTPTPPAPVATAPQTTTPAVSATPPATPPPAVVKTPPRPAATMTRRAHPAAPAPQSGSLLDFVLQYWYVPAALLALLVGVVALRWKRTRQEDAFDRSLGELSQASETALVAPRTDTVPVRTIAGARQEPSYRVEESGTHQRPDFGTPAEGTVQPRQQVAVEDAVPGEAPVALDQGDPLAEADFHMAYGLYDQAAELVQIAITREPKRRDLKLKLLEVFFVWGNRDRFLQTAHELAASRDQAPAGEWEKILIMGRQIAPDDALFADGRGVAGAGKVVDLNLEGGQNRVDFDLLGEPSLGAAGQDAVELDLSAALGEPSSSEATGEAPQVAHGDSIDLDLGDSVHHRDGTGSTREMPEAASAKTRETREMTGLRAAPSGSGSTETMRVVTEVEAPTVEQPQLHGGDHGTIRQKIDAAARGSMASGEQTAELAIDDLGLDLGALENSDEALTADPDAPTLLAGVNEETRRMFEGSRAAASGAAASHAAQDHEVQGKASDAHSADVTQRAPAVAGGRGTGTWMFTDTDFASISPVNKPAPTQIITQITRPPQVDTGATSVALAALRSGGGGELDLDLGSTGSHKAEHGNGIDLDIGTPAAAEGTYADTQKLSSEAVVSEDMALPDLEPVTLSEVGTKLDLARAYMDMGDPEGARSILSEVMSEGSVSQKQEARRLMEALPG